MRRLVSVCSIVLFLATTMSYAVDSHVKTINRIIYATPDGQKLALTLYLPAQNAETVRPAVLLIHGGAWLFGTRHQLHWYGRQLAEHGYVAASLSYRMMPKHGFPSCLYDCKAAVRWLRAHAVEYHINGERIGALGNSAGGHLAALLAVTRPEDRLEGDQNPGYSSGIQAVVNMYGVADLSYYRAPKGYLRLAGFASKFMDDFVRKEQPEVANPYDRASPVFYAHEGCCPMFFVHGLHDGQVPYAQAKLFHEQLEKLGVPTEMVSVPYGHAFDFFHPKVRAEIFMKSLAFLDKYLK